MHRFLPNNLIYTDADIAPVEIELIKYKLDNSPESTKVWLLYLPQSTNNQLELMEGRYLKQRYYQNHFLHIVGISKTKDKALELIQDIFEDAYKENGNYDARSYLLSLMEE